MTLNRIAIPKVVKAGPYSYLQFEKHAHVTQKNVPFLSARLRMPQECLQLLCILPATIVVIITLFCMCQIAIWTHTASDLINALKTI